MPISMPPSPISAAAAPISGCGPRSTRRPRSEEAHHDCGAAMNDAGAKSQSAAGYARRAWQSDVIVDLIKHYGFPYIALNPGASYRGLHDSLVNYGGNNPPLLLCQHEKIAVQIAHGYAKATGKPMAAIATMGIYYAYLDRCPVFVIG